MSVDHELVSILMPVFQGEQTLARAIGSVVDQTYGCWELLIVDDGSSDSSAAIARTFASTDNRITLVLQDNSGPAKARQLALENASGRYIAFLDADDFWLPEKLEQQLAFMIRNDCVMSHTSFRRVSEDESEVGRLIRVPERLTYRGVLGNTAIATSTVVVDRKVAGVFTIPNVYHDDLALWLSLLKSGGCSLGLNLDLVRYRVTPNSYSRNKLKNAYMVWRTYRDSQNLNVVLALYFFGLYAINAVLKYRHF
mgnify:CR=1 FL=1